MVSEKEKKKKKKKNRSDAIFTSSRIAIDEVAV